jgi:hypothetical protein
MPTQSADPATRTPRKRALTTLRAVQREMSALYWAARQGRVPVADAAKLAYVLTSLGRLIEGGDLERRIAALEGRDNANPATQTRGT